MKDLFFPVTGATSDNAALDTAAAVASAYGARLIATVPAPAYAPLATPWGVTPDSVALGEMLAVIEAESRMRAQSLRERLKNLDPASEIRIDPDHFFEPSRSLARQARYADLSLIACPQGRDGAIAHAYFRALLFESGRPVLVVPSRPIPAKRFSKMLIAWKPTRETTRAVHDAIAFLSPGSAEVLAIDPEVSVFEHGAEPGADIAAHLARHGIRTQVTTRPSASQSIAQVVMAHAKDTGADLVVAGGYGHGRLREWVLGGATRELFEGADVPVLFSH